VKAKLLKENAKLKLL